MKEIVDALHKVMYDEMPRECVRTLENRLNSDKITILQNIDQIIEDYEEDKIKLLKDVLFKLLYAQSELEDIERILDETEEEI